MVNRYRKINNLNIIECIGVSPIGIESHFLVDFVSREEKCKVLDMGTGTGYIAISLAKLGFSVVAVDMDSLALQNAQKNIMNNCANIVLIKSNLFSEIKCRYNIIVFNIPTLVGQMWLNRFLLSLGRLLPSFYHGRLSLLQDIPILKNFSFKTRRDLIYRFLLGCKYHLTSGGKIFMTAYQKDLDEIILLFCEDSYFEIEQISLINYIRKKYILKIRHGIVENFNLK